jgi:hypothetical protein
MPLVRARCPACTQPLGDAPHTLIHVSCAGCGTAHAIPFAADGQPAEFDASFEPARLARWIASARAAMARGTVGVAVGACTRCSAALLLSSKSPLRLPCPHCQTPVEGPAAAVLIDQWPEPFAKVEAGPELQLEYRIAVVEDRTAVTAGCAACGNPTPAQDASMVCRRCGAVAWLEREGPAEDPGKRRIQLGVRVDGTRGMRPFNMVVSLAQGEQMFRSDMAQGSSASSGRSLLNFTGIGCAVIVAGTILLVVVIWMLVVASK